MNPKIRMKLIAPGLPGGNPHHLVPPARAVNPDLAKKYIELVRWECGVPGAATPQSPSVTVGYRPGAGLAVISMTLAPSLRMRRHAS